MANFCTAAAMLGLNMCENQTPISAVENKFIHHLSEQGVSYGTKEEYAFRFEIFEKNEQEIKRINAENTSFTVGHNQFSTWTDAEYKKLLGARVVEQEVNTTAEWKAQEEKWIAEAPESVDWRDHNAVNAVKNQGQCGSCWAFSAVSSLEGHHAIQSGELVSLSEEQLVDCETQSHGCEGGLQKFAMQYAQGHSLQYESEYVYTAKDGSCTAGQGHVSADTIHSVSPLTSSSLIAAIAQGPVSVTVEADTKVFQLYTSGIMDSAECGQQLDHAITAVGYGTENGVQFYIVRNSWGASWGDAGYIRIKAVKFGLGICGIQRQSVWATTK